MTPKPPNPPAPPEEPPVALEIRSEPERVDFHFPVEIHMEEPGAPLDLDAIAEHVFTRLARRLG